MMKGSRGESSEGRTVGVLGGVTRDGHVMGNSYDFLSTAPDCTAGVPDALGLAVEPDVDGHVMAGDLPGVGVVEPWVRSGLSNI